MLSYIATSHEINRAHCVVTQNRRKMKKKRLLLVAAEGYKERKMSSAKLATLLSSSMKSVAKLNEMLELSRGMP